MIGLNSASIVRGCALLATSGLLAAWMTPPTRQHAVIGSPLEAYRHHDTGAGGPEAQSPVDQPIATALDIAPAGSVDTRDVYDDGDRSQSDLAERSPTPHRHREMEEASERGDDAVNTIESTSPQTLSETREATTTGGAQAVTIGQGGQTPQVESQAATAATVESK